MKDLNLNKRYFRKKIEERKIFEERCRTNNLIYEKLERQRIAVEDTIRDIRDYLRTLSLLKDYINHENTLFRNGRISFLNKIITDRLDEIFPDECLEARISYNDKNRSSKADLRLYDGVGNQRKPSISEGKFCQYLIGYTAVEGIIQSVGKNIIYIDEAFGVASERNLAYVGEMLAKSAKSGIQIILVSQKSELYSGIPHREIRMHKDPLESKIVIDEIVDL